MPIPAKISTRATVRNLFSLLANNNWVSPLGPLPVPGQLDAWKAFIIPQYNTDIGGEKRNMSRGGSENRGKEGVFTEPSKTLNTTRGWGRRPCSRGSARS